MGAGLGHSFILVHQIREELWTQAHCIFTNILVIGCSLVSLEEDCETWVPVESLRTEELKMISMNNVLILLLQASDLPQPFSRLSNLVIKDIGLSRIKWNICLHRSDVSKASSFDIWAMSASLVSVCGHIQLCI